MFEILMAVCCLWSGFLLDAATPPQGTWNTPVALSAEGATWLKSDVDSEGNVVALWSLGDSLQASYCPVGGNWTSASRLTPEAMGYSVAFDPQGNAWAIWDEETDRNFNICVATLPKGATEWKSLGTITTQRGDSQDADPFIGFTDDGTAIAGWINHNEKVYSYQVARLSPGATQWSFASDLYADFWFSYPVFSISKSGRAVFAWMDGFDDLVIKAVSLEKDGKTWSQPQTLSPHHSCYPQITFDAQSNALLLWGSYEKGGNGAAYLPVNSTEWEALPPPPGFGQFAYFQMGMDSEGNAVVFNAGIDAVKATKYYPATKKWAKTTVLDTAPGHPWLRFGRLSVDKEGNALALWLRDEDPTGILSIATCAAGGSWSQPYRLPDGAWSNPGIPLLGSNGTATLLYFNADNSATTAVQGAGLFP